MGHPVITITLHAYYPYPSYTFFSLTLLPMRCTFAVSAWNFSSLHFYGLDTYTTLVYLLYYYVFTPYSYHHFLLLRYIVWHFSNSEYSSFYYIFLDIFLLLRISLFQIYLTLPFHYLCLQLVFSHSPFTALHLISAVLKCFSIPQLPYLMKD